MKNKTFIKKMSFVFSLVGGVSLFFSAFAAKPGTGGGGTGTVAGGDLTGTYPNPQIAPNTIGPTELIDMPGLTSGSYNNPTVTVDADGRVTAIQNGTASSVMDENGHVKFTGNAPTIDCDGVRVSRQSGNDNVGRFVVSGQAGTTTAISCVITFAQPYTEAPVCMVSYPLQGAVVDTVTINSITLTRSVSGTSERGFNVTSEVGYVCYTY